MMWVRELGRTVRTATKPVPALRETHWGSALTAQQSHERRLAAAVPLPEIMHVSAAMRCAQNSATGSMLSKAVIRTRPAAAKGCKDMLENM